MDLSTLITPVLQTITYLLPKDSSSSSRIRIPSTDLSSITTTSSNSVAIDRALGTVASIGLTMAVYRLLSALLQNLRARNGGDGDGDDAEDYDGGETPVSLYAIAEVLLQGLWASGAAIPRTLLRTVGFEPTMTWRDDGSKKMRTYTGSCHCNSIRFRLRAPSHLSATDCQGKIRYPHIYTTASNFQLTSGTETLSVYYVKLPSFHPKQPTTTKSSNLPTSSSSSSSSSDDDESTEKGNIAAHTFCNRCGVHILRAPDPKSNELEVNTDCLDVFYDRRGKSVSGAATIDVRMEDEGTGRGLSGGRPMMIDRLTTVVDDDAENDDGGGEVNDDDGGGGVREGREENPMGGPGLGVGGKRVSARWGDWPNRQLSSVVDDDDDGDNEDKTESTTPHHNDRRRRARRPPRPPNAAVPRLDMTDTNSTDGISSPSVASSELSSSDRKLDDYQAAVGISSASGTTASVTMTKTTTTTTPSSRKNSFSLGQGTFQVDDGIATTTPTTPQQSPPSSSVALSQLEYYMRKHVTPPVSDAEE